MFRWTIYERRPDGTELNHTEEASAALRAVNAEWDAGWAFPTERTARLALAWLSVVYRIEDENCRDFAALEETYGNAFSSGEFRAWNAGCGMCRYCVRPITSLDNGYDDPIDPGTISFPALKEGLEDAIENVY